MGSQLMVTGKHAVQALGPNLDGSVVTNQVLPVLTMLSEDSDADVQFFAIQAMAGFTPCASVLSSMVEWNVNNS